MNDEKMLRPLWSMHPGDNIFFDNDQGLFEVVAHHDMDTQDPMTELKKISGDTKFLAGDNGLYPFDSVIMVRKY